jgi:hypothetical protein
MPHPPFSEIISQYGAARSRLARHCSATRPYPQLIVIAFNKNELKWQYTFIDLSLISIAYAHYLIEKQYF